MDDRTGLHLPMHERQAGDPIMPGEAPAELAHVDRPHPPAAQLRSKDGGRRPERHHDDVDTVTIVSLLEPR